MLQSCYLDKSITKLDHSVGLHRNPHAQKAQSGMQEYDLEREHHLQAALETMKPADPDEAETFLKEHFGAGSSTWTDWDQRFIDLVEDNRKSTLLYGTIGNGWHFLFCPVTAAGFWVCLHESMIGKGFLRKESVAALTEVACQKGLIER